MPYPLIAAAAIAGMQLYSGYMAAEAEKKANYLQAAEFRAQARQTKLTAKWNIGQRNKAAYKSQLDVREAGAQDIGMASLQGERTIGSQTAEIGGSGAVVGEGTTMDVLLNQSLQNAYNEMSISENNRLGVEGIDRQRKAENESEWQDATSRYNALMRQSSLTKAGAGDFYNASLINSGANAASTYGTAYGNS